MELFIGPIEIVMQLKEHHLLCGSEQGLRGLLIRTTIPDELAKKYFGLG